MDEVIKQAEDAAPANTPKGEEVRESVDLTLDKRIDALEKHNSEQDERMTAIETLLADALLVKFLDILRKEDEDDVEPDEEESGSWLGKKVFGKKK